MELIRNRKVVGSTQIAGSNSLLSVIQTSLELDTGCRKVRLLEFM